jgi:hypothetical protein
MNDNSSIKQDILEDFKSSINGITAMLELARYFDQYDSNCFAIGKFFGDVISNDIEFVQLINEFDIKELKDL